MDYAKESLRLHGKWKEKQEDITMLDPNTVKLGIAPIGWFNDDMPEPGAENPFKQTVGEMVLAVEAGR